MSDPIFQRLTNLPFPLKDSQCVWHKDEILICGGPEERKCYSYHTYTRKYKEICWYPFEVTLDGHCVVKLEDINKNNDSDHITLLSFGFSSRGMHRHTLVMKYVSVWDNPKKLKKPEFCNTWYFLNDSHQLKIIIGKNEDYQGVRAVIGNGLLFITYPRNNISVFDLYRHQFIKHAILPVFK
ncbi:hypothetical protein RFI_11165 [Reticulomyxa filosa]|uniref:Uncharacterized protein n=1 Tax=Reticulomyxa filosa TaxID=46433 RepID=X6NKS9_RETFI|nr:hypothetical protein RFI_11165 [Reticulomyxa filosa]|eukprot:ETO25972.1 hypothetical protein RFI_11165 [Reticulomyxa filosa]